MARKRYTPEQIIGMLREAEVRLAGERRQVRYAGSQAYQSYNRIWCLEEFEVCGEPC